MLVRGNPDGNYRGSALTRQTHPVVAVQLAAVRLHSGFAREKSVLARSSRFRSFLRLVWRISFKPGLLGIGLLAGFLLPYALVLDGQVRQRFDELRLSVPTRVYARPLLLAPGVAMRGAALEIELEAAGYHESDEAKVPGSWFGDGDRYVIASRGYAGPGGGELPRRVEVKLAKGQVQSIRDLTSSQSLRGFHLDPARIATLYGTRQEERTLVQLQEVPPLLVTGLQAVEDRDFKNHHGVDLSAIARAAWANLRAGSIVQGGSTLTQQLVRNLFLDRNQTLVRKANEALLAILIEAHYDKKRILETYINEVFLGQRGYQAVHGFAAASVFYFGRRLEYLRPAEIALLVGMVRGPSYYNPRRYPERALARRNLVLGEFHETGLIDATTLDRARARPLGISERAQLPRNRFPAFMQLVLTQITKDFDRDTLHQGDLTIFTTLAPSAQLYAEQALTGTLDSFGERGKPFEGAVVVTEAATGKVLAVVGGRDAGHHGFNRALDAKRSIGSLVKPFVYLVALSQPDRWSLISPIQDVPVRLEQPNGKVWEPANAEHEVHGEIPLIQGLVESLNLATVHLGLAIGVDRVAAFLESFGLDSPIQSNPSLLLGAIDLSPFQVARLYQYLAADAHALPLVAVDTVLGPDGKAIKRYRVEEGGGEYHAAAQLVTFAMQQVAEHGTAAAIGRAGLGWLDAAGKTGTSDSQRDSWFAGFTADRLAVVWVGRDDNKPTGLYGSSGALKVWIDLFKHLPTSPLDAIDGSDVEFAWVNPITGRRTDPDCQDAMRLPFIKNHLPEEYESCLWDRFPDIMRRDGGSESP